MHRHNLSQDNNLVGLLDRSSKMAVSPVGSILTHVLSYHGESILYPFKYLSISVFVVNQDTRTPTRTSRHNRLQQHN